MQLHSLHVTPWFVDIVNFIVASIVPPHASRFQIDILKSDVKYYVWDDPYLWRFGSDQVICILWEGPLHVSMRCPNNPLFSVRFFMFGALFFGSISYFLCFFIYLTCG